MLRRIGVLASLAVTAAMFAGISTAQAAPTAGVCVFEGLAGQLNPGIPNILTDLSPDTEVGEYTYGGQTAACAGVFEGSPQVATNVQIDSQGYYDNLLCGTGFAHDIDGSNTTVSGNGISVNGAGYIIPFVGGVGPLLIGAPGAPAAALANVVNPAGHPGEGHAGPTGPYTGVGVVQITPGSDSDSPVTRDNCITPDLSSAGGPDGDTDSFQVKGFFVAANPG